MTDHIYVFMDPENLMYIVSHYIDSYSAFFMKIS